MASLRLLRCSADLSRKHLVILVIGPSRAGKTTLIDRVLRESQAQLFDVDAHENEAAAALRATGGDLGGWEARWDRALPALRRREHSGCPWIVDMGAGTLQSPRAREFVRERLDGTVVIFVPFEDLRVRHGSRPPEDLRSMEFSADHTALYDGCPRRVNGADTLERSTEELREHIRQLLRS